MSRESNELVFPISLSEGVVVEGMSLGQNVIVGFLMPIVAIFVFEAMLRN